MEQVVPDVSEELASAVRDFIRIKRSMNDREPKPHGFEAWVDSLPSEHFIDRRGVGDYACWPRVTLTAVLPFFSDEPAPHTRRRPARVAVKTTLGSSYQRAEDVLPQPGGSLDDNIAFLTHDDRAITDSEKADVRLIRQLGLCYVACEGKNRVAFLAHHGQEWMPCELEEVDYPTAERLQLVEIREGPQRSWVCVKDGKVAELIAYPEFTLALLRAYGVRETAWSASWPMQTTVMNSFRMQMIDFTHLDGMRPVPSYPVDLEKLAQREIEWSRSQPGPALMIFLHRRLLMRRWMLLGTAVALLTLSVIANHLPASTPIALALMCGSFGALLGLVFGLCTIVRIKPDPLARSSLAALAADACADLAPGVRVGYGVSLRGAASERATDCPKRRSYRS